MDTVLLQARPPRHGSTEPRGPWSLGHQHHPTADPGLCPPEGGGRHPRFKPYLWFCDAVTRTTGPSLSTPAPSCVLPGPREPRAHTFPPSGCRQSGLPTRPRATCSPSTHALRVPPRDRCVPTAQHTPAPCSVALASAGSLGTAWPQESRRGGSRWGRTCPRHPSFTGRGRG